MKKISINPKEVISSLKSSKFFKVLDDDEMEYLLKISEFLEYDKDEEIIKEGEVSPFLYIIIKGNVHVIVKQEHEGSLKDVYICTIGEGDVIGEAAIFTNVKRTANVIANEKLNVFKIERKTLIEFINKYPKAGIKILMLTIYSLLRKLKEVNHELAFERKATISQDDIDSVINDFLKNT